MNEGVLVEMCDIISGILLGSWMIWFSSFRHATNCDAFVVFSRDAPIGAFLLALSFLLRSLSFFLLASCLHLDNPAFQFDSLNCTTSRANGIRV